MLNKSKLNLSVILLVIGIGFVPTGIFINGYTRDQVTSEVSYIITSIEDEVVDTLETQYLGLGITEVLPEIFNEKLPEIENVYARVYSIPRTLLYIKNRTLGAFPEFINATGTALAINGTIYQVIIENSTTTSVARNAFFNDFAFQDNYSSSMEGISEYMTGGTSSLNFTGAAMNRLLDGREVDEVLYPGLTNDFTIGRHVSRWFEFFNLAEVDLGNRTLMQTIYNCTWGQLTNVSEYIKSYIFEDIVKPQYSPTYTLEEYAEINWYGQWANASWVWTGINLGIFPEFEPIRGWEAGRRDPTNITYDTTINLWDPLNESTFVNDNGIRNWINAAEGNLTLREELKIIFDLPDASITEVLIWLRGPIKKRHVDRVYILPPPIGIGLTIEEYAKVIYLQQWANGTHVSRGLDYDYSEDQILRPNGDNDTLWEFPLSGAHYECIDEVVEEPDEGAEDYVSTEDGDAGETEVFDMDTFTLPAEGTVAEIEVWIYGYDDDGTDDMTVDINMNGWHAAQNVTMANVSAWYHNSFPINATDGTNAYLDALTVRFTAGANVNYTQNHYILTMYTKVIYAVKVRGFEVGIPIPTNITLNTAFALFDESNTASFIHRDGILNWIEAFEGNVTAQTDIMTLFNLDSLQLNRLTTWLFTSFRFDFMPIIAYELTRDTMTDFAQSEFYRQWSDGALFKGGLDPGPFLGLPSMSGWELGIPTKTFIGEAISHHLWGDISIADPLRAEKYANSLVNWKGISNWFNALTRGDYYNILQNLFGLTDTQMDAILDWLVRIRETFALPITQLKYNLPVDHYTFGNLFFMSFLIAGGIIGGLGVLGAILLAISKRK